MTSLREYVPRITAVAADLVGSCGRGTHRVKVWMQPCCLYPWQCPHQTIWYAITAMPPTPSSCIRSYRRVFFRLSRQAGAIWHRGGRSVPFPRVEAAWKEVCRDDCCCIDVERKRTFTMMIREGVAMHAFNGELFVQATWDTSSSRLFPDTVRMVSQAHQQPEQYRRQQNSAVPVCRLMTAVRWDITSARTGILAGCHRMDMDTAGYPAGVPRSFTFLNPWRTGRLAVQMCLHSVMEQMKMLDTLQGSTRNCKRHY